MEYPANLDQTLCFPCHYAITMSVLIYSTPSCPWCHKVKDYLKEKGVAFSDIDVSADEAKAAEMVEKSDQMGVPVIDIDGKIIVGFDKAQIDEALHL